MNKDHTRYLQYWNFLLTKDQTHYERTQYKLLEILGEIGGLISILFPILFLILEPFIFNKHKLKVFKEFQNYIFDQDVTKEKLKVPPFFEFKLMLF